MTRPNLMTCLILTVAWLWVCGSGVVVAEQGKDPGSTHPKDYTTIYEVERLGKRTRIESPAKKAKNKDDRAAKIIDDPAVTEIDDRSLISISFDEEKMRRPDENGGTQVKIRVEAFQTKGGDRDRIVPITNYIIRRADEHGNPDFVYNDRRYGPR